MARIETIIFDLAEVYLQGIKGAEIEIANVLGRDKEDVRNALLHSEKTQALFRGEMAEERYWNEIVWENNFPRKADGYGSTTDFLKAAVRRNFKEVPGTRRIIEGLKAGGYQLVLLSDHAREWAEYCKERYPLQELFGFLQWSFEEDITKKSPEMYTRALEKAGADAERTLFIDDNPKNLAVAESVGIKYTCQFYNAGGLERDLYALGCFKCAPSLSVVRI